ncbi:type II toxin-antitoxin system VapC family toxin [Phyllobacterium endophyticum]|uniref:VapC toxin family PIN domain ribonuclease n=1 Tax=Phyllobacterium endophyticum TaxID=1149773 RepID=A0A2P7B1V3_9HYPH|nr:type II toxin-antitoxin system VapC family toxin [Phyllobacterium endophyticum]MBB3238013.1 ribonuclease VapC [Phyllobacterium endophyticum]PSH60432.1 VapC toxin family PIN domain ribonuclease [Phyllobacterium endophyticum]TYR42608.1 type II toxin-antitoxin system VapC family toxin [Phyllobacterium endophyticum]
MFLDASAIVAILGDEEDAEFLLSKIQQANSPVIYSSLSIYEAVIGLARKKFIGAHGDQLPTLPSFIQQAQIHVARFIEAIDATEIPIGAAMHRIAIEASRNYGRAVAHPARLNFGDCFAYACAKAHNVSLLYKGDDFPLTDIVSA